MSNNTSTINLLSQSISRRVILLMLCLFILSTALIVNSFLLQLPTYGKHHTAIMGFNIITACLCFAVLAVLGWTLLNRLLLPINRLKNAVQQTPNDKQTSIFHHLYQDEFSHIVHKINQNYGQIQRLEQQINDKNQLSNQDIENQQQLSKQIQLEQLTNRCYQMLIKTNDSPSTLNEVVNKLAKLIEIEDLDLCLMKGSDNSPYVHISAIPNKPLSSDCINNTCSKCINDKPFCARLPGKSQYKIPLIDSQNNQIGILVINLAQQTSALLDWQQQYAQQITKVITTVLEQPDYQNNQVETFEQKVLASGKQIH